MAEQPRAIKMNVNGTQPSASSPIVRQELIAAEGGRAEYVHTAPGLASPWHHHGDYDTYICALSGTVRIEFGPGGKESIEVAGENTGFVPKHVVHRELTPGPEPGQVFLVRVGSGEPVTNVDGPDPA